MPELENIISEETVQDAISVPELKADTVYLRNPADVEYSLGMLSSRYNYQAFLEEHGTRKWKVQAWVGNDVRPTILLSRNREGLYLAPIFNMSIFDNTVSVGGGAEAGYMREYWGLAAGFSYSQGYPDETSDSQSPFRQLDFWAKLFLPGLEFKVDKKGSIFTVTPYIEGNWKKCKFVKNLGETEYSYVTETETAWITNHVKTDGVMDARPHVWGCAAGVRLGYHPWGKIWYIFANGDIGKSQRFTYLRDQWHLQIKVEAGVAFHLYPNTKKNTDACRYAGYDPQEIHF